VSFRIGAFEFTPHSVTLPLALAFFLVISYSRLRRGAVPNAFHAWGVLVAAGVTGLLGAWIQGRTGGYDHNIVTRSWVDLRFGSFGGYWGTLVGGIIYARCTSHRPLRCADGMVPGILAGGAVARLGCVYTGCCRGIIVGSGAFGPMHLFPPWPLWDAAALLITLYIAVAARRRTRQSWSGGATCAFLLSYGFIRFLLEFLRDTPAALGPLTTGQVLAIGQVLIGAVLFFFLGKHPQWA
jgi:prolipoprotein diacylglyceryltransferase